MPKVGETWEIRDPYGRSTRGIVSEITDTRVTLVAMTGARIHVPSGRFEGQWSFTSASPKTNLKCSRCKEPGILTFQRGVSPEYVCPRHLPVGVLSSLHTLGEVAEPSETPKTVMQCPECGNTDPVEDARLGKLDRCEFGWWTCTLCSSRWGLITQPEEKTDSKGRWYLDTIQELTETMLESSEIDKIECSRSAWVSIEGLVDLKEGVIADSGFEVARFEDTPIHMIASLMNGSILVRARRAPAGAAVSKRPAGIKHIGGSPGTSVPRPTGTAQSMIGALNALYSGAAPTVPGPGSIFTAPVPVVLPSEGSRYVERASGKEVEIVRVEENDGKWAIAVRHTSFTNVGSAPYIMLLNDFNAEFVRSGCPSTEPVPEPVQHPTVRLNLEEEWFSFEHNEYVRIQQVDLRRQVAVVRGGSSGRTRNVSLDEFADAQKFKKLVVKSVHEQLMDDD